MVRTNWPEGLDDKGAVTRVQSFLINAAEGRRNIAEDRQYTEFRKALKRRTDLAPFLPEFLVTHKSIDSFSAFIREIDSRSLRVEMVRRQFGDLVRYLDKLADQATNSSQWTGRPTKQQQAKIVKQRARQALSAVDELLAEQDRRLGNGGPITPSETAAIGLLRELREAIDHLIKLAETDQPLSLQTNRIAAIGKRALGDFATEIGKDAASISAAGTPAIIAGMIYAISHTVFGVSDAASVMIGTVAATGPIAKRWNNRSAAQAT